MKLNPTLNLELVLIVFLFVLTQSGNAQSNKQHAMKFTTEENKIIQIADSVAKSELKKFNDLHPNVINEDFLTLKCYDRTVQVTLNHLNSFQVNYKLNRALGDSIVFFFFRVIVDMDAQKTKFINGEINSSLSTPQKSWETLLSSLRTGITNNVKAVVTKKGLESLVKHVSPSNESEPFAETFKTWGNMWAKWETNCGEIINDSCTLFVGSSSGSLSTLIFFKLTDDGWRMDGWTSGLE